MTISSADVATLDNPQAVVDTWDEVLDGIADLAAVSHEALLQRLTALLLLIRVVGQPVVAQPHWGWD
jgi:phosphohistidine phosphatase SixA